MGSDGVCLMVIGDGLVIYTDKNTKSSAYADKDYFDYPQNTKNLKIEDTYLYFAGGNDDEFSCVDIEVWGLN